MTITARSNGWETGDDAWNNLDDLTKGTSYKYCGTYGARAYEFGSGTDMASWIDISGAGNGQSIYSTMMFNFATSLPAVGEYCGLYRVRDENGDLECTSGPVYDLKLTVEHSGGGPYTSTVNISAQTWYCLQVKLYYSNTGHVYVDLDGSRKISRSGIDTRDDTYNAVYMDFGIINTTATQNVWVDNCAVSPSSFPPCPSLPDDVTGVSASTSYSDRVDITWNASSGATGYYVYRDGGLIATKGAITSHSDYGADPPTITAGSASATDGTYTDKVVLSLSGESIANGTTHIYEVIPFNTCGVGGSDSDTGRRDAKSLNYQWQEYVGGSWSNISGATSDPYNYTDAPPPTITPGNASASDGSSTAHVSLSLIGTSISDGDSRNYRCKLTSTDATTKYSTSNTGYTGAGTLSYQWYRSSGDSPSGWGAISGATASTYNDTGAPAPTITPGTASATDGTYVSKVELSVSGESANVGAIRYYYCGLFSPDATPQNSANDSGYRGVGSLTYQWKVSAGDSDTSFSNIAGGTTDPYSYTGAPANGDGRYYYCELSATGAASQDSTHDRGYRQVVTSPISTDGGLTFSWGNTVAGSSVVKISSDGGKTWIWGLAVGTIVIPSGSETSWSWQSVTY